MQRVLISLFTISLFLSPVVHGQQSVSTSHVLEHASANTQDADEIRNLMNTFHHAVVAHDGERVASLFVQEGSTWFNVLSDSAFAAMRAKNPTVAKVRHSSFAEFSNFVSSSKSSLDPQHTNLQILSDGTIASAYFDFVFVIDGKSQNRGSETWQLVKASDGWRIAAITYSSNPML